MLNICSHGAGSAFGGHNSKALIDGTKYTSFGGYTWKTNAISLPKSYLKQNPHGRRPLTSEMASPWDLCSVQRAAREQLPPLPGMSFCASSMVSSSLLGALWHLSRLVGEHTTIGAQRTRASVQRPSYLHHAEPMKGAQPQDLRRNSCHGPQVAGRIKENLDLNKRAHRLHPP